MNFLISSQGAGVPPPPFLAKSVTVQIIRVSPAAANGKPANQGVAVSGGKRTAKAVSSVSRTIRAGTNTRTVPGRMIIALMRGILIEHYSWLSPATASYA